MSAYIAHRTVPQTNGNINNGLPALWSPWKRSRMFNRLIRTDDNTFDLYAVCNHKGNMQSGHYTGQSDIRLLLLSLIYDLIWL